MTTNKNLDPQNIFEKLDQNLSAIKTGLETGDFSKKEIAEMKDEFQELLLEGYKTKFGVKLQILSEEKPETSLKEVLVQLIDSLPPDINPNFLPILIQFIFENWNPITQKLAA